MGKVKRKIVAPAPLLIRAGARAVLDQSSVTIVDLREPQEVLVRHEGSGQLVWVNAYQLRSCQPARERLVSAPQEKPSDEELIALAWSRELSLYFKSSNKKKEAKRIAEAMGVSTRTVARKLKLYRDNPTPETLLPAVRGVRPGHSWLDPRVLQNIVTAVEEVYAKREHPSKKQVWSRVAELCHLQGVRAPHYNTVCIHIDTLVTPKIRRLRLGGDIADALYAPAYKGIEVSVPLEVVQIDHAEIDLIVVHPETRQSIGRPWITVAIDVRTRCIVGFYLALKDPDQTAVGLCLTHACNPKEPWLRAIGSSADYPMFGLMRAVHWDNAKTFLAKNVRAQCQRYGIHVNQRPVRRPHWGAYIERYIGTLMRALHILPGTTFSNPRERKDYHSEKRASFTLRELELWIVEEIQKYHHTPHSGMDGETPSMVWTRMFRDAQGKPTFPPMVGDPRSFYIGFLPSQERLVQTSGVSLNGVRYWDSSLTPFIKTGVKKTFHFDQRDMSKIYLDDGKGYIDIPVIDRSIGAFSAYELKAAKREISKSGSARASTKMLFEAVARQREIEEKAVSKSKAARVSQAKRVPAQERVLSASKESVDYSEVPALIDVSWEDFQ